jgi:eukaryotic-like serine/threonine-protein kinase
MISSSDSANSQALRELFLQAVELDTPESRQQLLDSTCLGNERLRRDVERLLDAHDKLQSFMGQPAAPVCDTAHWTPITERLGSVIDSYKLMEEIGEGGFGIVYLADQQAPVRRQVALKVIKPGMDTRQVVSRFLAELQALALMDHPYIARALDAGTTDSGRPYFVMELVRGIPITDYCDEHRLSIRERLALFVQVCQAIQHAHQKGIIHRDIKPSNVLVTEHEGRPVPKVIDFGVAKALNPEITREAVVTSSVELIGTPLYMSPEQADATTSDIDTRSDVYSLGVLLYELLTGSTPFEKKRLRHAAYEEIRRIIREEEPPKPSVRLNSFGHKKITVAAHRNTDPLRLSQTVRGDLDWIVMKALEKNRAHRYDTPSNFAADVTRSLANEPIEARPPSSLYRFGKFARRNRLVLTTVVLVAAALVAGTAVSTWQWLRASHAEEVALAAAGAEKLAKEQAFAREAETKAVLQFVEDKVFAAARPEGTSGGLGRAVSLRKAIESALPYVERSFAKEPLIEARLRLTLGRSFYYLGDSKTAAQMQEAASAIYATQRGPMCPDMLLCMTELANSYDGLGRFDDALKLRETVFAIRKSAFGPEHRDTLTSMYNVAVSYWALGRHDEARKLYEKALALQSARFGPADPDTLNSMVGLANSLEGLGQVAEACKIREHIVSVMKARLGPTNPDTLLSIGNLAGSYDALGRHAEARRLHDQSLETMQARLGPDHPATLRGLMALAVSIDGQGLLKEALEIREKTVAAMRTTLGPDHPDTLKATQDLANSLDHLGRRTEALELREQSLPAVKAQHGPDHPDTLSAMNNLAISYEGLGRTSEALMLRIEALARMRAKLGNDHPLTLACMHNLAFAYSRRGRHTEALELIEQTLAAQKAKLGPHHVETLRSMRTFANCYDFAGRPTDALKLREETLPLMQSYLGPEHPETLECKYNLACSYQRGGRLRDAIKLYEETIAVRKVKLGADHPDTLMTMDRLAECYDSLGGQETEALQLNAERYALTKHKFGSHDLKTVMAMVSLANSEAALRHYGKALDLDREAQSFFKTIYGPDDPQTLDCAKSVAALLILVDRGAEAVPIIDECVKRGGSKGVDPLFLPRVMDLRLQHFVDAKDAAGCRQTAEMWDKLKRTDPESLYRAACYRAVTAGLFRAAGQSASVDQEAHVATDLLRKAVAAGFRKAAYLKQEKCLDLLRASDAFKKVLADLELLNQPSSAKP